MKKYFLLSLVACLFLLSCKKNNSASPDNAINYKLTNAYYIGGGLQNDPVDVFDGNFLLILTPCHKTDIYSLYPNGLYKLSNADANCNKTDSASGQWVINGDNIILTGADTTTFLLDTDSTMITGKSNIVQNGDHLTEVYTHQ